MNFMFESPNEEINAKNIIAVKDVTYATAKRNHEKLKAFFSQLHKLHV